MRTIVALAVLALALAMPAKTALQPGQSTIRLTETVVSTHRQGELVVRTARLYNLAVRRRALGNSIRFCSFLGRGGILGAGRSWCREEFLLPRGELLVEGLVRSAIFYQQIVVGGTGFYSNVIGGSLVVSAVSLNQYRLIFVLQADAGQ
jgi:hypothetical protein